MAAGSVIKIALGPLWSYIEWRSANFRRLSGENVNAGRILLIDGFEEFLILNFKLIVLFILWRSGGLWWFIILRLLFALLLLGCGFFNFEGCVRHLYGCSRRLPSLLFAALSWATFRQWHIGHCSRLDLPSTLSNWRFTLSFILEDYVTIFGDESPICPNRASTSWWAILRALSREFLRLQKLLRLLLWNLDYRVAWYCSCSRLQVRRLFP